MVFLMKIDSIMSLMLVNKAIVISDSILSMILLRSTII